MSKQLPATEALIHVMVMVSASDSRMNDAELLAIGEIVKTLPVFRNFDKDRLVTVSQECAERMGADNGLSDTLDLIAASLPEKLHDTAYALGVEVAASDLSLKQEELRMLQMLRDRLKLDRLTIAAIERGVQARYRTI
nr:tellurite resistance TerB family protein [Pseudovibrio flavus]